MGLWLGSDTLKGVSPRESIDPLRFREAMARYASGIVVVTTLVEGLDHAMTADSFTSVSLDPALVLVCVERDSRFHEAVLTAGVWGISVLSLEHEGAARWFARKGRPLEGQLDSTPHHRGANGVAMLDGSLATLEVTTSQVHRAGDHDIVVGQVEALSTGEQSSPLVHFRREFRGL